MRSISSASVAAGFHAGDPIGASPHHQARRRQRRRGRRSSRLSRPCRLRPPRAERIAPTTPSTSSCIRSRPSQVLPRRMGSSSSTSSRMARCSTWPCATRPLAAAIARAVAAFDRSLMLFGLPGSELLKAGRTAGLRVVAEVFADRAYEPDGSLRSRTKPDAVIHDPSVVVARAVANGEGANGRSR